MSEIRDLTGLMAAVWGEAFLDPGIVRAIQYAGGYVAGTWDGDRLVAGSLAFVGRHGEDLVLHSHATCTAPGRGSEGIGLTLKWHQRRWALERGIGVVEWTYDPLVARNGWFNLTKLGARGVAYEVDFYGRMTTSIERGEQSDRCVVRWVLEDPEVEAAAAGDVAPADVDALRADGTPVLLCVDDTGAPLIGQPPDGDVALAQVPRDIEALRVGNPETAAAWRIALRDTLGRAMQHGRHLTAAGRDGWYVLDRP
jgi:predicted GNAT superfamily acetyltransferase